MKNVKPTLAERQLPQFTANKNSPSRRKKNRRLTEAKLLKAGTEVFSKFGYDAATTKLVSKRSQVNESLIMRYFGGKEGLLIEIIRRFFEKMRTTPLSYPPQESLEEELIQYLHYAYEQIKQHNSIFRIMILRASTDSKLRKKFLSLISAEGDIKLTERIHHLQKMGKASPHLNLQLIHLIAFQYFSTIFISDTLYEADKQAEVQQNLIKLISFTLKGLE